MEKFLINGRFFLQRITGTQRFSREIVRALDSIAEKGEFTLAVPEAARGMGELANLKNIETVYLGKRENNLWDQIDIVLYAKKHHMVIVNLNNNVSIVSPGIATIHDMTYVNHKDFHSSFYGTVAAKLHEMQFNAAAKKSPIIITDTHKSEEEIKSYYKNLSAKICVAGCGWDHISEIEADATILEKYQLVNDAFIFSLGSIEKNKNIKWVYEVAKRNRKYKFVISGGAAKNHSEEINPDGLDNIIFTGYISDAQVVALYKNCKAFAFPSIYEGFGIPPLEALALGCEVMCSRETCLPEIYGNTVHWFDPYNYAVDVDEILSTKTSGKADLLKKFTWRNMAQIIYTELKDGSIIVH